MMQWLWNCKAVESRIMLGKVLRLFGALSEWQNLFTYLLSMI